MDQLPLLPARTLLRPGESLEGFVRRLAQGMGYERRGMIASLLRTQGPLPTSWNVAGPGPVLEGLRELSGIPADQLLQATVHRFAEQLTLRPTKRSIPAQCDSKTVLRYFQRGRSPVCPDCLRGDPDSFPLIWTFLPAPLCPAHRTALLDACPDCRQPVTPWSWRQARCDCGAGTTTRTSMPNDLVALSQAVQQLLLARSSLIAGMSTAAQFWWLDRLRSSVMRTPSWMMDFRRRFVLADELRDSQAAWLAAAEILTDWPDRFHQFLEMFQAVAKHRTACTGVSRSFGLLLREAAWLEAQGAAAPADALRHALMQHYTQGHLTTKVCLFQGSGRAPLETRPWMTQTQAARLLGLRSGAIANLVKQGLLAGTVRPAGRNGRSIGVVRRHDVEALYAQLQRSVAIPEVAKRLGIGRRTVLNLIQERQLGHAVRTAQGWLIPPEALDDWESLYRRLPVRGVRSSEWITLHHAARQFGKSGFTLSVVLRLIRTGALQASRPSQVASWGQSFVRVQDLQRNREAVRSQRDAVQGEPIHRLAGTLLPGRPLKAIVLKKWIAAGLLTGSRHGPTVLVHPAESERFRRTYCLADEACALLNVSRSTLARWEKAGKVTPCYSRGSHRSAGASVYLRKDLEALPQNVRPEQS